MVKQLSVFLENRRGSLAEVTQLIGESHLNLQALSIADTENYGICRCIVSDVNAGAALLRASGYTVRLTDVLAVCVPDRPAGLAEVLRLLDREDISVEYLYSFVRNSGKDALIIFRLSDTERAVEVFTAHGIRMLSQTEVETL